MLPGAVRFVEVPLPHPFNFFFLSSNHPSKLFRTF
jgi:hypothetical protein